MHGGHGPVLGIDGCRGGWVGLVWFGEMLDIRSAASLAELIDSCRSSLNQSGGTGGAASGYFSAIGIDMPIGLADVGARQADRMAQRLLGRRASSIFITPARDACSKPTQPLVSERNRELGGPGVSVQAFNLLPKVREVDEFVCADRAADHPRMVEVHPELSFQMLKGGPLMHSKRTAEGVSERLELLDRVGLSIDPRPFVQRGSVAQDDVVDAAVVAWTAERVRLGSAVSIPDPAEVFSDGLAAAIWY